MAYALYSHHPETFDRREADFTEWRFWSKKNAPWTGVGIDEMAKIVTAVCARENQPEVCSVLDNGGDLTPKAARVVLRLADAVLEDEARAVLQHGVDSGYGVRVVFSKALGSAITASAYAAKFGSDAAH